MLLFKKNSKKNDEVDYELPAAYFLEKTKISLFFNFFHFII